jgi:hypothetical protein
MNECIVRAFDGEVIAIALCEGNLYQVTFTKGCEVHVANVAQTSTIDGALEFWHRRLGHLNVKGVHALNSFLIISTNIVPLRPFQNIINLPYVVENSTSI